MSVVSGQQVTLTGTVADVRESVVYGTLLDVDIRGADGWTQRVNVSPSAVSVPVPDETLRAALERIADPANWRRDDAPLGDWCWWCGVDTTSKVRRAPRGHEELCPVAVARVALAAVPADDTTRRSHDERRVSA